VSRVARWEWLALFGILIVGAGLRIAYLQEVRRLPDFERPAVDAAFHDYWARGIAFDEWEPRENFSDPGIRTSPYFRPPGYAYFLAAVYAIFGDGYIAARLVQVALGLAGVILAFLFARRWFGRAPAMLLAAGMSGYWIFLFFEAELQATTLFVFLLLMFLNVMGIWYTRRSFLPALIAGIVGGLATLVRPNFLAILVAALVWIVWARPDEGQRRRTILGAAGLVLGTWLAIAPVTIRNQVVSGEFVPISANSGINLFIGNNAQANGLVMSEIPGLGDFGTCFDWPGIVRKLEQRLGHELGDAGANAYFTRESLSFISENPVRVAKLTLKKALLFWGPREVGHNKEVAYERRFSRVLGRIPGRFPLLLALGLLGFGWLALERKRDHDAQRRWTLSVLVVLVIASYFLSVVPFFAAARYRVPILPLLLLFGAWALSRFGTAVVDRRRREIVTCVAAFALLYAGATRPLVDYEPSLARWHYDRGVAFDHAGDSNRARGHYEDALLDDPTFFYARYNLAHLLMREGRIDEAIAHWEASLLARENYAPTHYNLADIHRQRRDREKTVVHLERAFALDPDSTRYRSELGEALRDLSVVYSMHSDPERRDPAKAVRLAERSNALSAGRSPSVLDALAMAYASAGRFDDAVDTASRAIELARASGYDSLASNIEARLQAYRSRVPPP